MTRYMEKKPNKFFALLKRPRGVFLAAVYVFTAVAITAAMLAAVFGNGRGVLCYAAYALAALTLGYSVYTFVIYAPVVKHKLTNAAQKYAFTARLISQYGFRTVVFACFSFALSIAYVVFNAVIAVINHSVWYGALAAYYVLLTCLRGGILLYHRNKSKNSAGNNKDINAENNAENGAENDSLTMRRKQLSKYKNCGVLLTVLPIALSAAIMQMLNDGAAFVHMDWTVYAFAAYAFYKIILAVYNVLKAKKADDMTVQALRNIGLADAMVTVLALQTSLLHAFSDGNNGVANAITGTVVCLLTFAIGVVMIIRASVLKRKLSAKQEAVADER